MNDTIIRYIERELLNGGSVGADDDLLETGLVDSIGMMRLIEFLEKEFSLTVPFEDITIENFSSVSAMVLYLESHRAATAT